MSSRTQGTSGPACTPSRRNPCSGQAQAQRTVQHNQRRTRIKRACQRCKVKKVKCDAESPCERCKKDDLICVASLGKRDLQPTSYPETLENTQHVLINTIHVLYETLQKYEGWHFEEPDLNGQGRPFVHSIADRLGLLRQSLAPHAFLEESESLSDISSANADFVGGTDKDDREHHRRCLGIIPNSDSSPLSDPSFKTENYMQDAWASNQHLQYDILEQGQSEYTWLLGTPSNCPLPMQGYWNDFTASISSPLQSD